MKSPFPTLMVIATLAASALAVRAADADGAKPAAQPAAAAYPLDTCVVSGEKLGEMGAPVVIQHEGREVRFCCRSCVKKFKQDPAKYLKKIDEAAKAKASEKPVDTQPAAGAHA